MDFELNPVQKRIQSEAREFARREVAPVARECDELRKFPMHLIPRMGELGFLSGPIGAAWGGRGLDYLSCALIYEELGQIDSSVRGFLAVHLGLVSMCIHEWGTADQKHKYLPRLATGKMIGCYALTEQNAGSDVASIETTAKAEGEHYVLSGEKIWITNGNIAHVAIVFASVDRTLKRKGICAFLVEADTPGFLRARMPGLELGHRASDHAVITLKNCRVPASAMLGQVGDGFKVAMSALDHGRLGVAAGALGVAEACLKASLDYTTQRKQFDQPISHFQMIQEELADMATEVEAARWLVYRAAQLKVEGKPSTQQTSMAKLFATEVALRAASTAVLLHGSRGYSNEYPVERFFRDIKGYQIYEGTSHIQKLIIARSLLKERMFEKNGSHPAMP